MGGLAAVGINNSGRVAQTLQGLPSGSVRVFVLENEKPADMADFTMLWWEPAMQGSAKKAEDGTFWQREIAFASIEKQMGTEESPLLSPS